MAYWSQNATRPEGVVAVASKHVAVMWIRKLELNKVLPPPAPAGLTNIYGISMNAKLNG